MPFLAPSAPPSFMDGALTALQTRMTTTARAVLIDSETLDPAASWAAVGVGDDSNDVTGANIGTSVLGYADLGSIPGLVDGDFENVSGEAGRKLVFAAINNVPIVQTKSGIAKAIALVDNVATFAGANDTNCAYIVDMQDLAVDGSGGGVTINMPSFEVEIAYGTNKP